MDRFVGIGRDATSSSVDDKHSSSCESPPHSRETAAAAACSNLHPAPGTLAVLVSPADDAPKAAVNTVVRSLSVSTDGLRDVLQEGSPPSEAQDDRTRRMGERPLRSARWIRGDETEGALRDDEPLDVLQVVTGAALVGASGTMLVALGPRSTGNGGRDEFGKWWIVSEDALCVCVCEAEAAGAWDSSA